MTRYIDADALMETVREYDYPLVTKHNSHGNGMFTIGIQQAIDEQPTTDVVEVVRCKDCVNRRTTHCQMYWESDDHKEQYSWENDNDFCSAGCGATEQEGAEQ